MLVLWKIFLFFGQFYFYSLVKENVLIRLAVKRSRWEVIDSQENGCYYFSSLVKKKYIDKISGQAEQRGKVKEGEDYAPE